MEAGLQKREHFGGWVTKKGTLWRLGYKKGTLWRLGYEKGNTLEAGLQKREHFGGWVTKMFLLDDAKTKPKP